MIILLVLLKDFIDEWRILIIFSLWILIIIYIGVIMYVSYEQTNQIEIRKRWKHKKLH